MSSRVLRPVLLLAAAALAPLAPLAGAQAAPTIHEVYDAASAGHLGQAEHMMHEVLHDYPNSAKAHFVAAEIDARAGDLALARQELATAERLSPGLPFANAESVARLRRALTPAATPRPWAPAAAAASPPPWGLWAVLAGLGLAAVWLLRRRSVAAAVPPALPPPSPAYGGVAGYGGPAAPAGGGLVGSLATGVAMGAGVVAGEELVRHLFEPGARPTAERWTDTGSDVRPDADLGGTDFGLGNAGSWDDGGTGGDDWSS